MMYAVERVSTQYVQPSQKDKASGRASLQAPLGASGPSRYFKVALADSTPLAIVSYVEDVVGLLHRVARVNAGLGEVLFVQLMRCATSPLNRLWDDCKSRRLATN